MLYNKSLNLRSTLNLTSQKKRKIKHYEHAWVKKELL